VIAQVLSCDADAVKSPVWSILPHDVVQFTATFAVNCCVCPWPVVEADGAMISGDVIVALVEAV
jgi:hypothetical protein